MDNTDVNFFKFKNLDLIWYRNPGAGAKYFHKQFSQFDIKRIDPCDVEWDRNYVFGYITNPFDRRNRGIATWLIARNLQNDFLQNKINYHFLESPYFDENSEPISVAMGDRYIHIDWIPLDHSQIDAYSATNYKLSKYGISIDWPPQTFQETSARVDMIRIIESHLESAENYSKLRTRAFEKDLQLYKDTVDKFLSK
jgi:hypothetical protein